MFPAEPDPTGKPEDWTREDMRRWLSAVSGLILSIPVLLLQDGVIEGGSCMLRRNDGMV